jgi:hypothetical protein
MSDLLSEQIGAFRRQFGRFVDDGVGLTGEAVEAFDGLFASFQAQARMLEGGAPDLAAFDEICRAVSTEARLVADVAKKLEATTRRLRMAEVIVFPSPADAECVASCAASKPLSANSGVDHVEVAQV